MRKTLNITPQQQQEVHAILCDLRDKTFHLIYDAGTELIPYGIEPSSALINLVAGLGVYAKGYYDKQEEGSAMKELLLASLRAALMGHDEPIDEDGGKFKAANLQPIIFSVRKE